MSTPNTSAQHFEIQEKIARLEADLVAGTPNISTLLRDIHAKLKKDPDCVTLLTEEECAIFVRGLKKQTATSIATTATKSKPKKALSKITVADL